MTIAIPADAEARLREQAKAAGYDDVERFVADYVLTLSTMPGPANGTSAPEEALRASVAMCNQGMADAEAGKGRPADEVIAEIAAEFGLADPTEP